MKITALRSDQIYEEIIQAAPDEKLELYREQMMSPFMNKWNIQQIPFRSQEPHGFDVIMMNNFMNIAPADITPEINESLAAISSEAFWQQCHEAVRTSLSTFTDHGIELSVSEYLYTILLGDKNSPSLTMNEGISGDGGIPGYIIANLIPNGYTLPRMQSVLAHECNHNVRYQHIQWDQHVTLGEMVVSEGLAESFATSLYGEELLGPWVAKTDMETLNKVIKPKIKDQLYVTGFDQINPYLYGDELAIMQNFTPVGMPYAAGYACGYHLIQYYLNKTGTPITEATITPASVILAETKDFWNEDTLFHRKNIIQITGITKRALHYYDKTDLLKPSKVEDNGYRYYDQEALGNLQMILLFKEMNFSLKDIAVMMQLSKEEQKDILREHRSTLVQRKQKLETIIHQLDEYVDGTDISHLNLFDDSSILPIQEQYESEAKFIYGDTEKYQEFEANVNQLSAEEQEKAYQQFSVNMEQVFRELAKHQDRSPASREVQALVREWKSCLEQFMVCDAEILRCIAEAYTTDRRYAGYFDQFGDEEFLRFLYQSIMVFVEGGEK